MKKLVALTAFICFFVFTSYANDSIPQVNASLIYNDVKEALNTIATPLADSAKYGFEVLVKANFWKGIGHLISILIFFVLTIISILITRKLHNNMEEYEDASFSLCASWGTSIILAVVSIVCIFDIANVIIKISCPEYYAIQELLQLVK